MQTRPWPGPAGGMLLEVNSSSAMIGIIIKSSLLVLCILFATSSYAREEPSTNSKILVLSSSQFPKAWTEQTVEGIKAEFNAAPRSVSLAFENLDNAFFSDPTTAPQVAQSFKQRYPQVRY